MNQEIIMIYFHLHGMFNILSKFSSCADISALKTFSWAEYAQLIFQNLVFDYNLQ